MGLLSATKTTEIHKERNFKGLNRRIVFMGGIMHEVNVMHDPHIQKNVRSGYARLNWYQQPSINDPHPDEISN